jgi:hypothetical protein
MRQNIIQSSFLSGVLSPEAAARVDTDAYNQGLLTAVNVVPRPLGGLRRRPGLRFVDTLPNVLTRVTGQTITAPRGGTTANANDGSATTLLITTTDVSTLDPFVVVHYDLGAATSINFADVVGFVATGGTSTQFRVQYSTDNAAWTDFGDALEMVDTTERSYRRGTLTAVSARYWRLAKVGGTDMGAVDTSLREFNLWQNSSTVSAVRLFAFEVTTETRYLVVLTDRSMTVYADDEVYVRLPSPYVSADLAEIDGAQNQDSLVLVHEDYQPRFVYPELSTIYFDPITFASQPQHDYDDSSSPTPTSCVQTITFAGAWEVGATLQVDIEGARTAAIAYAGDTTADQQAATAANIAREVQKLYTVPGSTGVTCARTGALTYTVTFADASAKAYELMTVIPLAGGVGTVSAALTTPGVARTEDVWSTTRGWPRTVTFFEGRMYFGGSLSLPQSLFGSRVNQILDYEITEALDDDAIFTTLNGQQLNAVQGIYSGRSLQIFTSGGEFRFAKQQGSPVTPTDAPANQTQYGAAKIRPVAIDGATIFVQRTKKAIRDFRYDYEEDAFNSLGISALAPHLVNDVRDLSSWKGSSTDEINLVFVVNGDGTVAVYNSRREANVSAWVSWTTQGYFLASAGMLEDVYFAVRRVIDGTSTLFLEVTDPDHYTDCSVGGALVSSKSISAITTAWSGTGTTYYRYVDTTAAHGLSVNDVVNISGVVASGSYLLEGAYTVLEAVSTTRFRVKSVSSAPTGTYVSGGAVSSGTTTTMTGLSHLNGEEVRVRADGFVLDDETPAAGSITISRTSSFVEAGLNFDPIVTPMPLNMMMQNGANVMRKRRAVKVRVKVLDTLGLLVNGRPLPDLNFDINNFDEPASPFSGVKALEETTNWDEAEDKTITFTQVDPLPMTILGIDVAMEGSD